ncbi:hypothetical protein B0H63DRAFT_524467 [Podospora didyma]|uniref:HD domain-containing protein n=1 Tax=Podospora didyma TaxID=330526 RepID=A0AAE0NHS6_9PEZI|nr:hypothetical protein B0H63DRAFT_524467 [Podospora didyma]
MFRIKMTYLAVVAFYFCFLANLQTLASSSPTTTARPTTLDDENNGCTHNHVMRSWLFGALIMQRNATLRATLLHDLGLDRAPNSTHHIARQALKSGRCYRDAALHPPPRQPLGGAARPEPEVAKVSRAVGLDFVPGPATDGVATAEEYAAILAAFPRIRGVENIREGLGWIFQAKPEFTYGLRGPFDPGLLSCRTSNRGWGSWATVSSDFDG